MNIQKTNSSSLIRHVLLRTIFMIIALSLCFFIIIFPIAKRQYSKIIVNQADAFASATIQATTDSVYKRDFGYVVEYVMGVLSKSKDNLYVTLTSHEGQIIQISDKKWKHITNNKEKLPNKSIGLHFESVNPFTNYNSIEYIKSFDISGWEWGTITVGLSSSEYNKLANNITNTGLTIYFILIISICVMSYSASRRIKKQVGSLQDITNAFSKGEYDLRAMPGEISEINSLTHSFNSMATSIQEKTNRVSQLAQVVENSSDGVLIFNDCFEIVFANDIITTCLITNSGNLIGKYFPDVARIFRMDNESIKMLIDSLENDINLPFSADTTLTKPNNEKIHVSLRANRYYLNNHSVPNYFLLMTDISQRKELEQKLNTMAYYDKLTNLPNRQFFMHKLETNVKQNISFALFFIDLDDFKIINDTMGHDAGDELLKIIAKRLKNCLNKNDTVCRLGGDEFTVLIHEPPNKKAAENIAKRIVKSVKEPISLASQIVYIGSSIGIVHYPEDSTHTQDLLKKADMSMYEAKNSGKNRYRTFDQDMSEQLDYNLRIEADLHRMIRDEQLQLYYQPIYSAKDLSLTGFEALVRWIHPDRGIIPPSDFISIAERTGVIIEIGQWVIEEACRTLEKWNSLGFNTRIAINISGQQLHRMEFIDDLLDTVNKYEIDKSNLVLEFTESVLIENQESILQKLLTLKSDSFKLALDDFGTGFSSLSYLNYFPIDILKIDRSFISRIPHDSKACSIVSAITSLAHDLELDITVEGVEKHEHVNWLMQKHCSYFQGFYFNKPMPEAQAEKLLVNANNSKQSNLIHLTTSRLSARYNINS